MINDLHDVVADATLTNGSAPEAPADPREPSAERGGNGPSVEDRVRDVVEALTAKPTRGANGQFIPGAVGGAAKTLISSGLLLDALAPVKRDLVARVLTDRGLTGDAAETMLGFVDAYAEARLLRQSMWVRLIEQGGPVTGKGKKRALFDAYLGALDREARLAQTIGLERRARPVVSALDYIAGQADL